jgi:hypothetical protein
MCSWSSASHGSCKVTMITCSLLTGGLCQQHHCRSLMSSTVQDMVLSNKPTNGQYHIEHAVFVRLLQDSWLRVDFEFVTRSVEMQCEQDGFWCEPVWCGKYSVSFLIQYSCGYWSRWILLVSLFCYGTSWWFQHSFAHALWCFLYSHSLLPVFAKCFVFSVNLDV